jgi:hypothetical protein
MKVRRVEIVLARDAREGEKSITPRISEGRPHSFGACHLIDCVESAELRDKLHQIDNDFRERLRAVIPDWKYNPEF